MVCWTYYILQRIRYQLKRKITFTKIYRFMWPYYLVQTLKTLRWAFLSFNNTTITQKWQFSKCPDLANLLICEYHHCKLPSNLNTYLQKIGQICLDRTSLAPKVQWNISNIFEVTLILHNFVMTTSTFLQGHVT